MIKKFLSKKNLFIAGCVLLVSALGFGGWYWYLQQPKSFELNTADEEIAYISSISEPSVSRIGTDKIYPSSLNVYYSTPVVKMDYVGKVLEQEISVHPQIRGKWKFTSDYVLSFTPEKDWIPNTKFEVTVSKDIIRENIKLADRSFTFSSPEYEGYVYTKSFYEDPRDIKSKHAVATFNFTYPVESKDIKDTINVYSSSGEKYDFTYNLEKFNRVIHVMSAPVKIKNETDFVNIEIKNTANEYNGQKIKDSIKAVVTVPSISDFFRLGNITTGIVNNEQKDNNPEQILFVNFSTAVSPSKLDEYINVYAFKGDCYTIRNRFSEAKEDLSEIMKYLTSVELTRTGKMPEDAKMHTYRYDVKDMNVCLLAQIRKGLSSVEDYEILANQTVFVESANYPKESKIAFEGSLIPLKNEKSLSFVSRGLDKLNIKIARIKADDLNHLVTQTQGNFASPYFSNYNFNENNISEVFEKEIVINMTDPAVQNYSSLDLSPYLGDKKGIFLVRMFGSFKNSYRTSEDTRLVIITDLGLIVKDNTDSTHSLFVANLTTGTPVKNAVIDILGKNGLSVLTVKTDSAGSVVVPDFSSFKNEKEVVAYKVTKGEDISYLPVNRYDRRLDFSRFDVGGIYESSNSSDETMGYAFSDRGIYRPNEDAFFGLMVRQKDLNVPQNLPLQVEIRNSHGDRVAVKNVWANDKGLVEYSYHIPANAPLGTYNFTLNKLDKHNRTSYVTSANFKVEEFAPDNMRIKLQMMDNQPDGWYTGTKITPAVDLQNLYGNPASHHTVKAHYSLTSASFNFGKYSGYNFNDPVIRSRSSHYDNLPDTVTNDDGKAEFEINWDNFVGTYNLTLYVTGLELESGRGVSVSDSILVSPNKFLVGYKADGGTHYLTKNAERKINFIAIDNDLKKIELKNLKLKLYKKEYTPNLVEMPNGTYRYQMVSKDVLINEKDFEISANGVDYMLVTENPGEYYITVTDIEGSKLSRLQYNVVGNENTSYALDKEASLEIKLDKKEYEAGEDIQMQIKAPYSGYGLITIERDKVYTHKWFKSDTTSTTQTITIPDYLEGNAYANVAWVRDTESKEILMSPLSYAVQPFSINKESRRLNIKLGVPQVVKPGQDLEVKYAANESSQIILYGVNTGILQVANYQMPNPLDQFMKKRALRVVTSQILDLIMPDLKVARFLKGVGGDIEASYEQQDMRVNPFARKQQKPVAFWSGLIETGEDEQTYTYKVPENFNGEIKVMAVGASFKRIGHASTALNIRGDFALVPSGPFNVSPGDEFVVSISIANMVEENKESVPVEVRLHTGKGVKILGDDAKIVDLRYRQETSIQFKLKATDEKLGSVPLVFQATNTQDENKAGRITYELGIRPSNAFITDLKMGYELSKLKLKDFVRPMFEEYRSQEVTASSSPLVLAQGLIGFLDKFPHECTEQSVSKILPAVEVFFKHPELLEGINIYKIYDNVIVKLTERQTIEGGFKSWSSPWSNTNEFDSLYALQFLSQAKKRDFNVPQNMYKKAMQYARGVAGRDMNGFDDSNPAYAVYLLTLNGEMTSNYLIKLEEYMSSNVKKSRSSLAAVYMAASYQLLQNEAKARQYIGYYKLGSDNVDDARFIYLMAVHFPEDFKYIKKDGIEALLKPLKNANFTTISAAYSLLALNAFGNTDEYDEKITFNGQTSDSRPFPSVPLNADIKELLVEAPISFYYVVNQQGFMRHPVEKAESKGLELYKEYLDKDGNTITSAKLGDEIKVKLRIRYTQGESIDNIAIVDMIPGCLDIVRDSISGTSFDNTEVREDRALMYLTVGKKAREITYRAKVVAKGDFVVPAGFAEALYDPAVRANTKASRFNVSE